jgi:hypothetical protein
MEEGKLTKIAETLDGLIRLDIPGRGVIGCLYAAAREKAGRPLTLAAACLLADRVRPGDTVILATGWVDQPEVSPGCGESDGPPGTVALARAIRLALKATPVIVTDACLVEATKAVARAAGFECVPAEAVGLSVARNKLMTTTVLPFPEEAAAAGEEAARLLTAFKPAACIAIERGGGNGAGVIHNMAGLDTSASQAKLDQLFAAARRQGVATLAIGDGGNEIGMGNIAAAVRERVPYGAACQCGCGGGLAAATEVDVLVTASISNWGSYALAALLAAKLAVPAAAPDEVKERRVLEATAAAGFHDPLAGGVFPGADGCGLVTSLAMVTLILEAVRQGSDRY